MASRTTAVALATVSVLLTVAGCAQVDLAAPSRYASPAAPVCTPQTLSTRTPGRWTVATGARAAAPWFVGNRPENGRGFESAVAYAVAGRLGFDATEVSWVRVNPDEALAAGRKPFDVAIDLFAHRPQRKDLVDMSSWYYLDRQAVVTLKSSAFASATGIAQLSEARLGAKAGSTGLAATTALIGPADAPQAFEDLDDARRALWRKQIDGLVTDLPTAFSLAAAQPAGLVVVGQLPRTGVPDQFGLVLEKDSPLTPCVKQVVDDLRIDGSLLELEKQWLVQAAGVAELS
jgi:polar amino acid transport system substrate-binding protein